MTRDMQDNLEKFIKDNRNKFDDLTPNKDVWKGIDQNIDSNYFICFFNWLNTICKSWHVSNF